MNNESFGKWICKWWYMVRRTSTKLFARTFASPGRFSWAAACSSTGRIAGYQAGLDRFLWHVPNSHVLHVEDCFVRFFRQRNDVPVPRHESHLNEGRAPRIRKISESLHQKSPIYCGKSGRCRQCCEYCKVAVYFVATIKTWLWYCYSLSLGGEAVWWVLHVQLNSIHVFCASKIGNGFGRQSSKNAEGRDFWNVFALFWN